MAANIDALASWLGDLFGNQQEQEAFNNDSEGVLHDAGFDNVNAVDVQQAMSRLAETNQGNQSFTSQGGFADFSGSGVVNLPPPPSYGAYEASGDGGGLAGAIDSINHYTSVTNITNQDYQDNDTTVINDQDTNIDNSINQDITAFGDVTQDFDQNVVTGDHSGIATDGSQVQTGDGVQVGGNVTDSTIATGDVGGSVTGDVSGGSVVGDGNEVLNAGPGSEVGPVAFGGGDAIDAENVNQGSGAIVDDVSNSDVAVNTGGGDQAVVQGSTVDDSSIGGGDVHADDTNITATDDSSVAFGDGSSAESTQTNVTNDDGTVQVAGDDSVQQAVTDNSENIVNDFDDGGYQGPPVLYDQAPDPGYDAPDTPDHDPGAPTIDDGDTINQSVDTVDDGIDA
jgi:hypothetical protein